MSVAGTELATCRHYWRPMKRSGWKMCWLCGVACVVAATDDAVQAARDAAAHALREHILKRGPARGELN